jgi:hypothetical protein
VVNEMLKALYFKVTETHQELIFKGLSLPCHVILLLAIPCGAESRAENRSISREENHSLRFLKSKLSVILAYSLALYISRLYIPYV